MNINHCSYILFAIYVLLIFKPLASYPFPGKEIQNLERRKHNTPKGDNARYAGE